MSARIVPGPKILMMGPEGTGKTDSVRSLIEAGLKVFCVFAEPGMEVLLDGRRGRKVYSCADGLHWRYHPLAQPDFKDLQENADLMNKFSFQQLKAMAPIKREKFRCYYEVMATLANLNCERCGQTFGPADQLTPYNEWAVVIDSLTSLSKAALYLHIGIKPAAHEGEYGVAMFNLERIIDKFVGDVPSMGIVMGHIEREPSNVDGGLETMVATLGQKLAPKIPRPFSDAILTKREGDKFFWSTTEAGYKLKTRNFAFSKEIPPTFGPVVKQWQDAVAKEQAQLEAANATAPKS